MSVKINLLPQEIRKKRNAEKGLFVIAGILVLVIGICIAVSGLFYVQAGAQEKELAAKKAEVAGVTKEIEKFGIYKDRQEQVKAHEAALEETLKNEILWHRFVNEISMIVPADVALGHLELDETGSIALEGACFEYSTVAELMVRLTDMDTITDIWLQKLETTELDYIEVVGKPSGDTSVEKEKINGTSFSITARLKEPVSSVTDTGAAAQGSANQGGTN